MADDYDTKIIKSMSCKLRTAGEINKTAFYPVFEMPCGRSGTVGGRNWRCKRLSRASAPVMDDFIARLLQTRTSDYFLFFWLTNEDQGGAGY